MKNTKTKPKAKVIKELAQQFEEELKQTLPISIQPNGNIVYKSYLIKQNSSGNWSLYRLTNKVLIETYHLKSCALMAAKAYDHTNLNKFFEIKQVDNKYWASYSDNQIYQQNIKKAKDFNRYLILLNKLEDSGIRTEQFKEQISRMFKWSFA
jgi:alcohol dehydrogenase YqhD (iron-dependent ADH family)